MALTENERRTLARMIEAGEEIPSVWRSRLFPEAPHSVEIGKEYRLEYAGKMKREQVLAETPAAPWQLVRSFNSQRPFDDGRKNLLVWGDNLLALRGPLADQQEPNRFSTKDKIKLIYIDPPFATKQDFKNLVLNASCPPSAPQDPGPAGSLTSAAGSCRVSRQAVPAASRRQNAASGTWQRPLSDSSGHRPAALCLSITRHPTPPPPRASPLTPSAKPARLTLPRPPHRPCPRRAPAPSSRLFVSPIVYNSASFRVPAPCGK
ncbi:MAG: hypothetical protein NTW21_39695 [Verrucomicrobia bacterium]|nr:hypothetical protein [Verrucomicrobiota bacterium]